MAACGPDTAPLPVWARTLSLVATGRAAKTLENENDDSTPDTGHRTRDTGYGIQFSRRKVENSER